MTQTLQWVNNRITNIIILFSIFCHVRVSEILYALEENETKKYNEEFVLMK